jgi:hypothetical protein
LCRHRGGLRTRGRFPREDCRALRFGALTRGDVAHDGCPIDISADRDLRDGRFDREFLAVAAAGGEWTQMTHRAAGLTGRHEVGDVFSVVTAEVLGK